MDGAFSLVHRPVVLLDLIDEEWFKDTLSDDGEEMNVDGKRERGRGMNEGGVGNRD